MLLIAAFWLGLWSLAAWAIGKPLLLPSPPAVLLRLIALLGTKSFYLITASSLWNVLFGILVATLLGVLLSLLTSRSALLREAIFPVMTVIKATPVASFIVLALIWIGAVRVPSFITVLIVLPIVWTNLDVGFSKIDPNLIEVARVYQMPFWRRVRRLTLPSLKPYFVSACRTSLGLAWKAGVAAEIIAMPPHSIGTMIGDAKQYMETVDLFAWSFTVILLSLGIELLMTALFRCFGKKEKEVA